MPADPKLAIEDFKVSTFEANNCIDAGRTFFDHPQGFFLLAGNDHDLTGLDDSCLFFCDLANGRSKPLFVVDRDGHDDADSSIDHVRRVPSTSHSDFDDGSVNGVISKGCESHNSEDFKE